MGRPPQSYATIQMDNAGGHGRKEDIERYESGLLDKGFKVNFQPSNSPDLNVLDLGVWRGLQAEVDKLLYVSSIDHQRRWVSKDG